MNILDAVSDPKVFASAFRDQLTWQAWRAFLATLFGLPLDDDQRRVYAACTGRSLPPLCRSLEAWLIIGRRGGKSFVLALIAVFVACFQDWRPYLGPGERATVMVIAADRKQARVILRYVKGLLAMVPMLARTIEAERNEGIDLSNRVTIEVHTASFRTVRGYTIVAALLDELAFWRSDETSASPDTEVVAALRPAMATVPGALLLCASSPYAKRGALYEAYKNHFGKDGDPLLVWQAPTRVMNPSVPQSFVDDALAKDPDHNRAELLAEFRDDISAFIDREAVEACVSRGVRERAPLPNSRYFAFVDPSGGSSDSFTLAISHREKDRAVIDLLREMRPPFSPEATVDLYVSTLRSYRINRVSGDRYGAQWVQEQFRKRGVEYWPAEKPKSDLYLDLLPAINSGTVDLLDNDKLVSQLSQLERRTARSGKDSIDHAPGAHDDLANAVAGAAFLVAKSRTGLRITPNSAPRLFEVGVGQIAGPRDDFGYAPSPEELADRSRCELISQLVTQRLDVPGDLRAIHQEVREQVAVMTNEEVETMLTERPWSPLSRLYDAA